MLDAAGLERVLRAAGSRITRPRSAVPDAVHALRYVAPGTRVGAAGAGHGARVGDDRHHLVGRSRGAIADVDRAVGVASCPTPSDDGGFVIDEAEVTYWGLCPACSTSSAVTA